MSARVMALAAPRPREEDMVGPAVDLPGDYRRAGAPNCALMYPLHQTRGRLLPLWSCD